MPAHASLFRGTVEVVAVKMVALVPVSTVLKLLEALSTVVPNLSELDLQVPLKDSAAKTQPPEAKFHSQVHTSLGKSAVHKTCVTFTCAEHRRPVASSWKQQFGLYRDSETLST